MQAAIDLYFKVLKAVIALLLAVMVVMVFANVVLRYAFNSGITTSEELARWCLVWMTFIGSVVALRERQHLGMDFLVQRMSRRGKTIALVISHVLMLYAVWLVLWGSWRQTLLNLDVSAPATGLSTGWFYGIGVYFGVSAGIILLHDLYRVVTGTISEEELVGIVDNEEEAEVKESLAEAARASRSAEMRP